MFSSVISNSVLNMRWSKISTALGSFEFIWNLTILLLLSSSLALLLLLLSSLCILKSCFKLSKFFFNFDFENDTYSFTADSS